MSASDPLDAVGKPAASATSTMTVVERLVSAELAIFIASFVILWPTTTSLVERWDDVDGDTYTHGYFIVLIGAWLLWRNRARFRNKPERPCLPALLAVAAISCVWLILLRSGIQAGHQILLPVLIWLAMVSATGLRTACLGAFSVAYLYFAMPVWGMVSDVLQAATTAVVGFMLHVTGVVATIDGNLIHLPQGTFEIAAGCSGVHFFIVALAIAALYGEVHRDSIKVRIQLLVLAAILAAVSNWIRAYIIILAGYMTDMQHYLVRVEHDRFGWVVFALMMACFVMIARRLPVSHAATDDSSVVNAGQPMRWIAAATALAFMAVGPMWNYVAEKRTIDGSMGRLLPVISSTQWRGPLLSARFDWTPRFDDADWTLHGRYVTDDDSIEMYVAMYASQRQGKELVAYDNSILGAEKAEILRRSVADGWQELEIKSVAGDELIRYRYQIGNVTTPNPLWAQLSYGWGSLVGAPISQIVALRSGCIPDCETARQRMTMFAVEMDRDDVSSGLKDVHQ